MQKSQIEIRNCKHCNEKIKFRRATSSMKIAFCKKCKRAYALLNAGPSEAAKLKLVA